MGTMGRRVVRGKSADEGLAGTHACRLHERRTFASGWLVALFVMTTLSLAPVSRATPSQQDVFKSIQDNVGQPTDFDARPVIFLAAAGGAALLLVVGVNYWQKRRSTPRKLNHPAKLLKEVVREVPLSASEVKQLKLLADNLENEIDQPAGPLLMLLCPSLLGKALKTAPPKLDRRTVAGLVRRLKLGQPSATT
jgi:hypothetical protein